MVLVDGARFLPCNCTITKVVGSCWSAAGHMLSEPFEGAWAGRWAALYLWQQAED